MTIVACTASLCLGLISGFLIGRKHPKIADAVAGLRLTSQLMPSGAGHDAQDLARIGPMGMIFVPSVKGISHSPLELTRPQDVTNGANVLLQTILRLDHA